ncbi:hypothetical protein TNCV_2264391 [Trichonephila clavipes]|nr:hypothetical protein TNCV_2264391 [Trichonephila clavipes]
MFRSGGQSDAKLRVFSPQSSVVLIYRPTEEIKAESDPVDDETDEDEDNNSKVARVHQMLAVFCVRDSYGVVPTTMRVVFYLNTAAQENQRP